MSWHDIVLNLAIFPAADPEERHNLAESEPDTVAVMMAIVEDELDKAVDVDMNSLVPDPAARDPAYNNIWTSGWC